MRVPVPPSEIAVGLSPDVALVLGDVLYRLERSGAIEAITRDHAELIALSSLTAALEPLVDQVFSADDHELLAAANVRLTAE